MLHVVKTPAYWVYVPVLVVREGFRGGLCRRRLGVALCKAQPLLHQTHHGSKQSGTAKFVAPLWEHVRVKMLDGQSEKQPCKHLGWRRRCCSCFSAACGEDHEGASVSLQLMEESGLEQISPLQPIQVPTSDQLGTSWRKWGLWRAHTSRGEVRGGKLQRGDCNPCFRGRGVELRAKEGNWAWVKLGWGGVLSLSSSHYPTLFKLAIN